MHLKTTASLLLACSLALAAKADPRPAATEVYFSPKGGCTEAVVRELGKARASVLVQAYSFTSSEIAQAVVDARKRGVKVQAILDKSNLAEKYSAADFVAHNKVMVIDGSTVITGSFNFPKAAEEHNAENLLVIRDPALAARYAENWKAHAAHSKPYAGR